MKAEYTIEFFPEGCTEPITRTFKPRYSKPTNRARAEVANASPEKFLTDMDVMENVMGILLVGNTDGVKFADALADQTTGVLTDFFTMYAGRSE
jgi:hypothetical protein